MPHRFMSSRFAPLSVQKKEAESPMSAFRFLSTELYLICLIVGVKKHPPPFLPLSGRKMNASNLLAFSQSFDYIEALRLPEK